MTKPEKLAIGFIEDIWNNGRIETLHLYLHPEFADHSLPAGAQNSHGFRSYLTVLGQNVSHFTEIENVISEQDFIIMKIKVTLKASQNQPDAQQDREVMRGYRILAISDQQIIGHWEFFETDFNI